MRPTDSLPPVERESADRRVAYCVGLLHIHGFLTDAERGRVQKRIRRWRKTAEKKEASTHE